MANYYLWLYLQTCLFIQFCNARYKLITVINVEGITNCTGRDMNEDYLANNFYMKNVNIKNTNIYQKISATIQNNVKDLPPAIPMVLTIERCTNRQGKDCEYFLKIPMKNVCESLQIEDMFFSELMKKITPPIRCPLNESVYELTDGILDAGPLLQSYADLFKPGIYWLLKLQLFITKSVETFCFEGIGQILPKRLRVD